MQITLTTKETKMKSISASVLLSLILALVVIAVITYVVLFGESSPVVSILGETPYKLPEPGTLSTGK